MLREGTSGAGQGVAGTGLLSPLKKKEGEAKGVGTKSVWERKGVCIWIVAGGKECGRKWGQRKRLAY